jgi:hypothetical protein
LENSSLNCFVLILGEKVRGKKRTSSPAISETSSESQSEDLLARARRRSRSSTAEKDRGKKTYFFCAECSFQWILIVWLFNGV